MNLVKSKLDGILRSDKYKSYCNDGSIGFDINTLKSQIKTLSVYKCEINALFVI